MTGWQEAMTQAITDPKELLTYLELPHSLLPSPLPPFPLRVPKGFVARMKKGDPLDPLLRQVLPLEQEWAITPGYSRDPLQEEHKNPLPGLLHKFKGRVLLITTSACGIHCRYCFRQHFPYAKNNPGQRGRQALLEYIAADTSINEVILSGGDPLVVTDQYLATLCQDLSAIPHVKRLRIHSRMPIVLPKRVTPTLIEILAQSRLQTVLVVHCNHPQEIDDSVRQAMQKLAAAGITLLNQSVLLRGVNDAIDTLIALSEALFATNILPYYLFTPDKVQGTAHFDLPLVEAKRLHQGMSAGLPGYLVPRLAKEEPGELSKVIL